MNFAKEEGERKNFKPESGAQKAGGGILLRLQQSTAAIPHFCFMIMRNNFQSKFYRTLMAFFSVAKNRRGACANCGACCQLPVKCFFLRFNSEGKSHCAIWSVRPLQCRKYPRTEKEWITPGKCGYRFE